MAIKRGLRAAVVAHLLMLSGISYGADADLNTRMDALEKSVAQMGSASSHGDLGTPVHGFVDIDYGNASKDYDPRAPRGFGLGNFDLYLTPQLGERVRGLVEYVAEVDEDGSIAVDLERLQAGYSFNDMANLWAGRFHSPYGYWNTAFHHGAHMQLSTNRPKFIDFEDKGGILPAHTVGLWLTGRVGAGTGKLVYDLYGGNGSRIIDGSLDMNNFRDDNQNRAIGVRVGYQFRGALEGLLIGVHGLREEVDSYDASDTTTSRTRLNMTGGYAYYDNDDWELIAEYYRFDDKDLGGNTGSHVSNAGYVQIGRTFFDALTPYARWERASINNGDAYFTEQESGQSYTRDLAERRHQARGR